LSVACNGVPSMIDDALPFGFLGTVAYFGLVRRSLDRLFDYRRQRLTALFPPDRATPLASVKRPPG
jgi:hypothetical protein